MFHWFETLRIEDGQVNNLKWHQKRVESTLAQNGIESNLNLETYLQQVTVPQKGIFRCRIDYSSTILGLQITPYIPASLCSLKLVFDNDIEYNLKSSDRQHLEHLRTQKGQHDDILIVKKNKITDISYANIVFKAGNQFVSPISPLLRGTQLSRLTERGQIQLRDIHTSDLKLFTGWIPINALRCFNPNNLRPMSSIEF